MAGGGRQRLDHSGSLGLNEAILSGVKKLL